MKELLYISFGWLLGLLSPLIGDYFQERKRRRDFLQSAIVELKDIQFTLASSVFLLETQHGRPTVELVKFVGEIMDRYGGNEPVGNVRNHFGKLRDLTQEQLDAIMTQMPTDERAGSSLKVVEPRYLISNLGELSKLPSDLQLRFYELLRTLNVMNQEIPKIDAKTTMTFDTSMTEENHRTLLAEIKKGYVFVSGLSQQAARKIDAIIAHTPIADTPRSLFASGVALIKRRRAGWPKT